MAETGAERDRLDRLDRLDSVEVSSKDEIETYTLQLGEVGTLHNETGYTIEEVIHLPFLAKAVSKWRGRLIILYEHPDVNKRDEYLLSVGISLDGRMAVIAEERKASWERQLAAGMRGEVYVSE